MEMMWCFPSKPRCQLDTYRNCKVFQEVDGSAATLRLMVAWACRAENILLISARKATKRR